ncbi:transcriptional regulator [Streptomyces sp. NRRL F-4489]|uniref:transcriptional regulator n=1 Tax=Streptomyces sp. NRRL F-4489 TaxID=1609095 RepID=UPI00074905D1|nr:transcriptional regulator [Streptomyces sp. NRRL F-4489]KUL43814.1 transcriptional regulator [Streptomyces sp. NRRL F-4489]
MTGRPVVPRQSNQRLRSLIQEAVVSNSALARQVNVLGQEQGLDLRYDKTSVSRWLRGQQPRGRVPAIIAEALSSRLGRTVSTDEIGMANGNSVTCGVGLHFAADVADALEQVRELWQMDAESSEALSGTTMGASALVEPTRDWLISAVDPEVARSHRLGPRAGPDEVELVLMTTRALAELDHRMGGGYVRPVLVSCLHSVVSGLLGGSYGEATGRQLFAAAARLTELAGYTAMDTGRPGLAQRYYIQAVRLAQAADERCFGGYVLASGLSRLAVDAGCAREAVQLARAAQEGTRGQAPPAAQALFYAAEARGYALLGDSRMFGILRDKALEAMAHADPVGGPEWLNRFNRAYLADELAHCYRDLRQPRQAARRAAEALARHPRSLVRRRTIDLLLLATAQVQAGEVEEGCRVAEEAVGLLRQLRSALGRRYLERFLAALRPYRDTGPACEFDALLKENEAHVPAQRVSSE